MKWLLRIFDEEPRDIGCAGLIIVIIFIVLFNKCCSFTATSPKCEDERISAKIVNNSIIDEALSRR